jgi:hypothetical protein
VVLQGRTERALVRFANAISNKGIALCAAIEKATSLRRKSVEATEML